MATNPPAEVGQVWRDNDERSVGNGEFEVTAVLDNGDVRVKRASGRHTTIRKDRLALTNKRGYTYIGRKR